MNVSVKVVTGQHLFIRVEKNAIVADLLEGEGGLDTLREQARPPKCAAGFVRQQNGYFTRFLLNTCGMELIMIFAML